MVSDLLNVSEGTIRNLERAGRLHPGRDIRVSNGQERPVFVYDPEEVVRIPARSRGPALRMLKGR